MADGFAKVVKWALFLANCIILMCGIAVLGVGVWTLVDHAFMEHLMGTTLYRSSAIILIVTGTLVVIISFLGCFGAIKEIKCMLLSFFIILFMIFVVMLVGGIMGYIFRYEVRTHMFKRMNESIEDYGHELAATYAWDAVQENLGCCGLSDKYKESYKVWSERNERIMGNKLSVPNSCCKKRRELEEIAACQADPKNMAHTRDCYQQMRSFVQGHALILGGIGVGTACILVIGMMLSCALYFMIEPKLDTSDD